MSAKILGVDEPLVGVVDAYHGSQRSAVQHVGLIDHILVAARAKLPAYDGVHQYAMFQTSPRGWHQIRAARGEPAACSGVFRGVRIRSIPAKSEREVATIVIGRA
jgi:hypothetical protein